VEPDGSTPLDNTLVVFVSEFGNGNAHSPARLPIVLAGGRGGAMTMGRQLRLNGSTTGSLFTAIQNELGIVGNWADDPSYDPLDLG
jgi:hypothetical protein